MLLPSIFGESLLDEFFDHPHQRTHFQSHTSEMIRTKNGKEVVVENPNYITIEG